MYKLRPGKSTLDMDNWSTFGRATHNKGCKTEGCAEKMMEEKKYFITLGQTQQVKHAKLNL